MRDCGPLGGGAALRNWVGRALRDPRRPTRAGAPVRRAPIGSGGFGLSARLRPGPPASARPHGRSAPFEAFLSANDGLGDLRASAPPSPCPPAGPPHDRGVRYRYTVICIPTKPETPPFQSSAPSGCVSLLNSVSICARRARSSRTPTRVAKGEVRPPARRAGERSGLFDDALGACATARNPPDLSGLVAVSRRHAPGRGPRHSRRPGRRLAPPCT